MFLRRLTRRSGRLAPPLLLTAALASYAFALAAGHARSGHVRDRVVFVQRLGAASAGTLVLASRDARPVDARWQFAPLEPDLQPDERIASEEAFIAGERLRFERPDGYARLSLDGRPLTEIHPRTRDFAGAPWVGADAGTQIVDVPPGVRNGFRFTIPASSAGPRAGHTLDVTLAGAVWPVERAGLRATLTSAPQTPPASSSNGVVFAALAGLAAAVLAYLFLALLPQQAGGRKAAQLVRR